MNMLRLKTRLEMAHAVNLLRLHQVKVRFSHWRLRHGLKLAILLLMTAVLFTVFSMPVLQQVAGGYFSSQERLAALRGLLGGTGAALIGAAAIAFSLVVFAMQINVERMPHGLFKQLSSDKRLLSSFLGSFLTAIVVAGTSLIPDGSWGIPAIITAVWGIAAIVLLFLYAYRRALQLINPIEQLAILSSTTQRDLKTWSGLADKAAILLREVPEHRTVVDDTEFHFNAPKAQFYKLNAHWSTSAGRAIHYAISYAKRFAEQGDYEVTGYAFKHMMMINVAYCEAKRGTFIGSNPLFEMRGSTDGFINTSLEQLRQTMQAALAKGDERLAESALRAIGGLYEVYMEIEYPGRDRSKHHALLASGYLGSAVESVISHNMPDLMMEGVRLMGRASRVAIDHTYPIEIVSVIQKVASLSSVGVTMTSHQPVTLTAFEQLADVTYDLLTKVSHDLEFPVRQLRSAVTEAAKGFLETSEAALGSLHRNTLGPYFSSTSVSSFRGRLSSLVTQLTEATADNARASELIDNIETWADQNFIPQKELLLLAVQKRSSFTFDVVDWAVGISDLLNALSNAPACTEHVRDDLRRHAVWLVSTLSWLPDDRDSVTFVENYSLTERLFEAASNGYRRDCLAFYETCIKLLLAWAKKGGKYETGWGILETSVKALTALAIGEGNPEAVIALKTRFGEMLASDGAPSAEVQSRAAANLTRSANQLRHIEVFRSIERTLAQQDHFTVRALLLEMAGILVAEPPEH